MLRGFRILLIVSAAALAAVPAFAQAPAAKPAKQKPSPSAASAAPAGTAVAVVPAAFAVGPGDSRKAVRGDVDITGAISAPPKPGVKKIAGPGRTLVAGQDIFGNDTIETGEQGNVQILFKDDTRLVVGPDSSVVIDSFVYDAGGSASGATMNFAKGAFRFITGKGAHGNYVLNTPTAAIGIRGTQFDVAVGSQGTAVIVFKGAVEVCHRANGQCATIRRACSAAIARTDGSLTVPRETTSRAGLINASFPLVKDQRQLRKDFRVFAGGCGGSATGAKNPAGDSGGTGQRSRPNNRSKPN